MGERTGCRVKETGYRVKDNVQKPGEASKTVEYSSYLRQQWGVTIKPDSIKIWILEIAKTLGGSREIGSGLKALRHDLDCGRLFNALVSVTSEPPFDRITKEKPHDISNHGILEIEIVEWNYWQIRHIPVEWDAENGEKIVDEKSEVIAVARFEEGKPICEGYSYEWRGIKEYY